VRLLLLAHGLPVGGTEMVVCHLARRLRSHGFEVAIGCLDEVGDLGRELVAEGLSVELYSRRQGFDPALPFKIARHARRGAFDLVHAHQYTAYFYGVLAKALTGVPLIFTEHGRSFPDLPSSRRRAFNRVFAQLVDRVTAVSCEVRESLRRVEGFNPETVDIIYNGIDVDRHPPPGPERKREARQRLGLPVDVPVVGTVGRLDPIKNHPLLLGAFRAVLIDYPAAVLAVVGDGPERARLERLAWELDVAPAVRFLGTRFDVDRVLPAFDVFALSSFSEGTPMALIEAMAASVPIVSTGVGGIPEMVADGREALLVAGIPPSFDDVEDLEASAYVRRFATALKRLLGQPDVSSELARHALDRARRQFSLDGICRQYRALYESVVPAPREERSLRKRAVGKLDGCRTAGGASCRD
jgi:L-malate glycosyltransferase